MMGATRRQWLGTATGSFVGNLVGTLIFRMDVLLSVLFAASTLLFLVFAALSKPDGPSKTR
jgi:hypothetical protein